LKTLICLELSGAFDANCPEFATSCVRTPDSTVVMDGATLGGFAIAVGRAQNLREHEISKRASAVAGPWSNLVFSAFGPAWLSQPPTEDRNWKAVLVSRPQRTAMP